MRRHAIIQIGMAAVLWWMGVGMHANAQSRREQNVNRDLVAGAAAYEDELYPAARRLFEQAHKRARDPDQIRETTLWLVRAQYKLGAYEDVLEILDETLLADADERMQHIYRFWRGRVHYAMEAYSQVIDELNAVDPAFLPEAEAAQRLRMIGRAYARADRNESALRVYALYDDEFSERPETADNLLDWSASLMDLDRGEEAEALLRRLIADYPDEGAAKTGRLWLGVMLADRSAWDEAREVLQPLLDIDTPASDRIAQAWYTIARIEEAGGRMERALDALASGRERALNRAIRNRGRLLQARVHFALRQWDEGTALLREVIADVPGETLAADAQLALANALLDQEQYERALRAFQEYLEVFAGDEGRARAQLGRGWSLLGLRRLTEAADAFERAYEILPGIMERERALFKLADAYFQQEDYTRAREEYLLLTQVFPGSDMVAMALFQAAECLARKRLVDEAISEFRAVEDAYPVSPYAERAAMRIGGLQEEMGEWDQAVAAYDRVMAQYPDGALFAEALHRRGMIRYRLGLFKEALADFEGVVNRFAHHPSTEQAFYMRGWCLYLLGNNEEALAVCETFMERYPDSHWGPDVLFWLAAYYFNQAAFAEAERRFVELHNGNPAGALADQSLYWAGRSAMEQEEYLQAIDYFNQFARSYPNSPKMPDVRFAQGDTLSQLGEFAGAILAFEEVIRRYPDHPLVSVALGRKGDCHFTLGNEAPERYHEAIASYDAVRAHPATTELLTLQAEYKRGRSLEKLGAYEEALEDYLRAVYQYVDNRTLRGREGMVWFTRAAFAAATLEETAGRFDTAINILQRVVDAEVTAAPDAERRIEQLQRARAAL